MCLQHYIFILGTARQIRRETMSGSTLLANGIIWEWANDYGSGWNQYTQEISQFLESQMKAGVNMLDLSTTPYGLPYTIDLKTMTQRRNHTGTKRAIRRSNLSVPYTSCGMTNSGVSAHVLPNGALNNSAAVSGSVNSGTNNKSSQQTSTFRQYMTRQCLKLKGKISQKGNQPVPSSALIPPTSVSGNSR